MESWTSPISENKDNPLWGEIITVPYSTLFHLSTLDIVSGGTTTCRVSMIDQRQIICRDVDGPRECHTEWSKSEKNKYHILTHMWNLEKWYRSSYLQSRNRNTEVENKCTDTKGERGGWEELGDWDWHIYTIDAMYKIDN